MDDVSVTVAVNWLDRSIDKNGAIPVRIQVLSLRENSHLGRKLGDRKNSFPCIAHHEFQRRRVSPSYLSRRTTRRMETREKLARFPPNDIIFVA